MADREIRERVDSELELTLGVVMLPFLGVVMMPFLAPLDLKVRVGDGGFGIGIGNDDIIFSGGIDSEGRQKAYDARNGHIGG